jgi:hypothetical protein
MASDWSKLRLILHIGPHKTGTTSLQQALLNRYGAEEPAEIWYPIPKRPGPGHAILAAEIINDGRPSLSSAIRAASQGNCNTLIVSSENFSNAPHRNRMETLAEQAAETDLQIVATLSPLYQRALSTWQAGIRRDRWHSPIADSVDIVLAQPGFQPDLIDRFATQFPQAKLSVLITNKFSPEKLYAHFAQATEVALDTSDSGGTLENSSLGFAEAEILRGFGAMFEAGGLAPENYWKARLLLRGLLDSEEWRSLVPRIRMTLPETWVEPLARRTAETIARLRALVAQERIQVFGDITSLDDGKVTASNRSA